MKSSVCPIVSAERQVELATATILPHATTRPLGTSKIDVTSKPGTALAQATMLAKLPLSLFDIICFSSDRWSFLFQRTKHVLSRFAQHGRVFFIESPVFDADGNNGYLEVNNGGENIKVVTFHLPPGRSVEENEELMKELTDLLVEKRQIYDFIAWYNTSLAFGFSKHLFPKITIYDRINEPSSYSGSIQELGKKEQELFEKADLVFTTSHALYTAEYHQHSKLHFLPHSIDPEHFILARFGLPDPMEQVRIPKPRIGFFGDINEQLDLRLLARAAKLRPEWQFIMAGPMINTDRNILPQESNLHYLAINSYEELPAYISNWDVAMLPIAVNEATQFINPAQMLVYLAVGKPVVSTPIPEVIKSYHYLEQVFLASNAEAFIESIEKALEQNFYHQWLASVDSFLSRSSLDKTWERVANLIYVQLAEKKLDII